MQYDHEPRGRGGGGGGAGLILVIFGGCALLLLIVAGGAGFWFYTKAENSRRIAMEEAMRAARKAEAQAMEAQHAERARIEAEAAEARAAEAAALAAKAEADAKRAAQKDLAEQLAEGVVPLKDVEKLRKKLATLQHRFDRRVAEDDEMIQVLRRQLEETRTELEKAQERIRALEAEKNNK